MLPKLIVKDNCKNINKNENEYTLQFDGCSKGNPGLSGAGAVLYNYDKEIWSKSLFVGEKNTNNEAEYTGLIIGLEEAVNKNIKCLHVEGDSMLVIKQMKGEYKVKSESLAKLYNKAKDHEKSIDFVCYKHIYRENNSRADELSNLPIIKMCNI